MYYYIYDTALGDKKYAGFLARIENRLTDLGINGKINRLSFLKNIKQVISDEIKRGIKTVVVVGDDKTLGQILNIVAGFNIAVGYIPITQTEAGKLLNIPEGERACDILSARVIKKIDLGKINNYYFLTSIQTGGQKTYLDCDGSYYITLQDGNNIITINNLSNDYNTLSCPTDGHLDLFIETIEKKILRKPKKTLSRFPVKALRITSDKSMPLLLMDEKRIIKTPADIEIAAKQVKMVVGKGGCII